MKSWKEIEKERERSEREYTLKNKEDTRAKMKENKGEINACICFFPHTHTIHTRSFFSFAFYILSISSLCLFFISSIPSLSSYLPLPSLSLFLFFLLSLSFFFLSLSSSLSFSLSLSPFLSSGNMTRTGPTTWYIGGLLSGSSRTTHLL